MVDPQTALTETPVAVVGFARTGRAVAEFLQSEGAYVLISEARDAEELGSEMQTIKELSDSYEVGKHTAAFLSRAKLGIVSPGVPLDLPALREVAAQGVELMSELEFAFLRRPGGKVIGVSGTNGKSTTTALLGEILKSAGTGAIVCGNIGTPFIQAVADLSAPQYYIVEVSSFQLEGIERFHPYVSVLLNISPDHQDRYTSHEAYRRAKLRLFSNQGRDDLVILNADDPLVWTAREEITAPWLAFSTTKRVERGMYHEDGQVFLVDRSEARPIIRADDMAIQGAHNIENAMAASLAALRCGVGESVLIEVLREFQGLPHRLQHIATVQGVEFYDDSKATNVAATVCALETFEGGVTLILGGRDKGGDFRQLGSLLRERVKRVLLIGEAASSIHQQVGEEVDTLHCGTLEKAVRCGVEGSETGDVVLLAPGCASFDQFRDYAHRGEVFQEAVRRWAGDSEEHSALAS